MINHQAQHREPGRSTHQEADVRLYRAICSWLEADAASKGGIPEPGPQSEPHPEGNNFTQAEHAHSYTAAPELHAGYRGQSIDDDEGGVYRVRPVGFRRND